MMADGEPSLRGISCSERMAWLLSLVTLVEASMGARSRGAAATQMERGCPPHLGAHRVVSQACWKGCCKLWSSAAAVILGSAVVAWTRGVALSTWEPFLTSFQHGFGRLIWLHRGPGLNKGGVDALDVSMLDDGLHKASPHGCGPSYV